MDPSSKDRGNNSGTHAFVKVGDNNNNNNHSNRWGRNRNRKVIWFNLPFCKLTNIDIGKYFLNLLDKHFNRDNPLRKIFNMNTVKISYSCTKNMYNILNNHNRRLLDKLIINVGRPDVATCNCRSKGECSLGRHCNLRNIVYQACISPMECNNDGERVYIGISARNWKQRLYNHRHSFSDPWLKNQIALSKYFWNLKDQGLTPQIKWKIVRQSSTTNSFNGRCN